MKKILFCILILSCAATSFAADQKKKNRVKTDVSSSDIQKKRAAIAIMISHLVPGTPEREVFEYHDEVLSKPMTAIQSEEAAREFQLISDIYGKDTLRHFEQTLCSVDINNPKMKMPGVPEEERTELLENFIQKVQHPMKEYDMERYEYIQQLSQNMYREQVTSPEVLAMESWKTSLVPTQKHLEMNGDTKESLNLFKQGLRTVSFTQTMLTDIRLRTRKKEATEAKAKSN